DGKVEAFCGTHTHVQTNDAKILPNGTAYITDVGMTGPENSAIGANFEEVYKKMRLNGKEKFKVSDNDLQLNAVVISLNKNKKSNQKRHKIKLINIS
ncbi:YmdB family metallophosphoesterase, partial [Mycoplasmopsis synoviae]